MRKQPEITERTRRNILEAFWSLYSVKRIDQITVKEIVAKAGYNRGTFYEYFSGVRDCLDRIENQSLPNFDELPPLPGGEAPTPDFIESFVRLYREKLKYYDVLLGERGDPSFQRKLIESIKSAVVAALPGKTMEPGGVSLEIDFMLEYVLSGMIGIMRYYFHDKSRGSTEEMIAMLYKIMQGEAVARKLMRPPSSRT